jgi:hypothetical protein
VNLADLARLRRLQAEADHQRRGQGKAVLPATAEERRAAYDALIHGPMAEAADFERLRRLPPEQLLDEYRRELGRQT